MRNKLVFTTIISSASAASLSAQAPTEMHPPQIVDMNVISLMEQNALLASIGILVLIGILWICYVLNECATLNKPTGNRNRSLMTLLILVVGLCAFCSSCTVAQRARMAQSRAAMAENHYCTCPAQHDQANYANAYFNNRYASNSNWQGPAFCRYCGHRMLHLNH